MTPTRLARARCRASPLNSLFLLTGIMAAVWPQSGRAETLRVGSGERFTDIDEALSAARAGDVVLVTPGTYEITTLYPPSDVSLVGEGGATVTRLFARNGGQAIIVERARNVRVEGFDIYSTLEIGQPTNALFYIEDSSDVLIRDCFIHDAPSDADVVKVNGTQDLIIENTIIWNPASRVTSSSFQENIDIRGSGDERITLRGCWLFHEGGQGDYLVYAKGGTTDLLWENNVFGPSAGEGSSNVPVETGHLVETDPTPYESERFVVRNNLFVGLRGTGAFAFAGPNVAVLHNNVFYRNREVTRALIELSANRGQLGGPGRDLFSFNNIFFENDRPIYRVRDEATAANLTRDSNLYEASASGGDLDLADESGSIRGDPDFEAPRVPSIDTTRGTEQVRAILAGFRTSESSPARDTGVDVFGRVGALHPSAIAEMAHRADAFGNPRGAQWDIGLFEGCSGPCLCAEGLEECGDGCVDTTTHLSHCGGCGAACGSGENCVGGACIAGGSDAGPSLDAGPRSDGGLPDGGAMGEDSGCRCALGVEAGRGPVELCVLLCGLLLARRRRTSS